MAKRSVAKKTTRIENVAEFVSFAVSWQFDGADPTAFRGQSSSQWAMDPRIFRSDIGIYDHENSAVRELVSVHPQEFATDATMFDRLVRMQHFELPTRLLDVTSNPLVALWFAAQDHREGDELKDGKVQAFFVPDYRKKYYDSDRVSCLANMANLTASEKREIAQNISLSVDEFNEREVAKRLAYFVRMEKSHFEQKINPADLSRPYTSNPK